MSHKDGFTNATRKPHIRRWLQSKGYHPSDIASALIWYDQQPEGFRNDPAIAKIADESHENICGKYEGKDPSLIKVVKDISLSWKLFVLLLIANLLGSYLFSLRELLWGLVQIQFH